MVEKVFLTEARREALNHYDPDDSNHRAHKSRVAERARVALEELMWVASVPAVDNADVFDEDAVRALLTTLLDGSGGVITKEGVEPSDVDMPGDLLATKPDPDYRDSLFAAISKAQLYAERNADPTDIYEMFGKEAEALREFDAEEEVE